MNIFRPGQRVYDLSGTIEFKMKVAVAEAAGWWLSGGILAANCIAAYQPKGAASLAASYVNLANSGTYNAAPGTAPNFAAATGWGFTGTQYLTTGVVLNNATSSVIFRLSDAISQNASLIGTFDGANTASLYIRHYSAADQTIYFYGSATSQVVSGGTAAGVLGIAGADVYKNGIDVGTLSQTGTGGTREVFIGAINLNGNPSQNATGNVQAVAFYNTIITPTQVAALTTAMAAL